MAFLGNLVLISVESRGISSVIWMCIHTLCLCVIVCDDLRGQEIKLIAGIFPVVKSCTPPASLNSSLGTHNNNICSQIDR